MQPVDFELRSGIEFGEWLRAEGASAVFLERKFVSPSSPYAPITRELGRSSAGRPGTCTICDQRSKVAYRLPHVILQLTATCIACQV